MTTYTIEPEVAGGLGAGTVMDTAVHPPRVERLDHEFAGWLGDDLLEAFPCYVVSQRLADALSQSPLTGYVLADLIVSTTADFPEHHDQPLPQLRWLKVHGRPGVDDLWLDASHVLTVTEAALATFQGFRLDNAVVEPVN